MRLGDKVSIITGAGSGMGRVAARMFAEQGAKVVVFSQWERMLRLAHWALGGALDARGARAEVFHGGLDSRARGRMLEDFRDDPSFRVLLSTDAGGLGLNLQEAASIVVNLEVPWNPAVLEQRIGRVHRIGQVRGVRVLHFVTKGAIEERVLRVVEGKRALFEGLLTDEADTEFALRLVSEGRHIFRYDTFGNEVFWGETLRLHEAIANVSPSTALAVGLKVDVEALPRNLQGQLRRGKVDLVS